jgi:hypothetical protein
LIIKSGGDNLIIKFEISCADIQKALTSIESLEKMELNEKAKIEIIKIKDVLQYNSIKEAFRNLGF